MNLIIITFLIILLIMYMIEYNRLIKSELNLNIRLEKCNKHNRDLIKQVAELTRRLNE